MALKQVKNKIISTQKTGKVTKAMESVSAVKMRKSQERALSSRPYAHAALRILHRIMASRDGLAHPLAQKRGDAKVLLVIVTSDKGLAGSVNSSVLKLAEEVISDTRRTDIDCICVGRKAVDFANRMKKDIVLDLTNVRDDVELVDVYDIATTAVESFAAGNYDVVKIVYQNFLSTFEQEPKLRTLLPLTPVALTEMISDIPPAKGLFAEVEQTEHSPDYVIEPSAEEVLNTLVPQLVQIMVFHALLESKASEHSARMVAMKNATDKSKEVVKALTIEYNKERQAAITAEVSEITAGVEAMK